MNRSYQIAERRPADMNLLGLPMHRTGIPEVHAFIRDAIAKNQKAIALNLNVHCVNLALKHRWLYEFIQRETHLVFCDGDGVRMGLKLLGYAPPPKVTYNQWIWQLADFCNRHGYRLFFLGGKPGVAEEAAERLVACYPGLQIAGVHHGYFPKQGPENRKVMDEINRLRPDILLVCFGMPAQEKWIAENWHDLDTHIFLKGGAAFDYASGRLKPAPEWIIRLHLEWFFRLCQDPFRLFGRYILGNPYFLIRVLRSKWKQRKGKKESL